MIHKQQSIEKKVLIIGGISAILSGILCFILGVKNIQNYRSGNSILLIDFEILLEKYFGIEIALLFIPFLSVCIFLFGIYCLVSLKKRTIIVEIETFTLEKKNALTYGAVLITRNEDTFDSLSGDTLSSAEGKKVLIDFWGGATRENVINQLNHLTGNNDPFVYGTHRFTANDIYATYHKQIKNEKIEKYLLEKKLSAALEETEHYLKHTLKISTEVLQEIHSLIAWNTDRAVSVARWSFVSGLISEQEAWTYIFKAKKIANLHYHHWHEYFAAIMIARTIWSEESMTDDDKVLARKLIVEKTSIYQQTSF